MFEHFESMNAEFAKNLPQETVKILRESSYTYSSTGMRTPTYSTTTTTGYVGSWSIRQIEQSAGRLSVDSKKVILVGQDINSDDLIEIGEITYKIDLLESKRGYTVLGISKK
jgi:hypothetical protein